MIDSPLDTNWELRFGARVLPHSEVEFRVWAPRLQALAVRILQDMPHTIPMDRTPEGEFSVVVPGLVSGTDYEFVLKDGRRRPDPVSRWQPEGVHGPSRIVDPAAHRWSDDRWRGLPLERYVIYELHTGTFTAEGTFDAVIPRLTYLKQLGITAVELMPVAQFPGTRNWGYDGASLYAPHSSYGGPEGLKRLIDACHGSGLAVVLDVVYNHLGPEGNYLGDFTPCFTSRYRTPWGDAINFDGPDSDGVRRFFIDNALYWLTEFHADALRLDAVHGIYDFSALHFLDELASAFHRQARRLNRAAWVIAESDLNDIRIINPRSLGGYGLDAQWNDDFHHSLHTVLTGGGRGYLADFGRLDDLAKAIREGYVYDGRYSSYRRRRHGNSSLGQAGKQFVVYIQNHDQIANACLGTRLSGLVTPADQKLAAALVIVSPFLPLIFMGQEYGETAPFYFFTSYEDPVLVEAVREGRRKEHAEFYAENEFVDPQDPATFASSRLNWELTGMQPHAGMLHWVRDLIALRSARPCLSNCRKDLMRVLAAEEGSWLLMERWDPSGERALLLCNFAPEVRTISVSGPECNWHLALWSENPVYDGRQGEPEPERHMKSVRHTPARVPVAGHTALLYLTPTPCGPEKDWAAPRE